jgi:hypothetical protein
LSPCSSPCPLEQYGRQSKDTDIERYGANIKLRAIRRLGEISAALPKSPGAKKDKGTYGNARHRLKKEALAEAGVSQRDASRAEQVAAVPEKEFEDAIAETEAQGDGEEYGGKG